MASPDPDPREPARRESTRREPGRRDPVRREPERTERRDRPGHRDRLERRERGRESDRRERAGRDADRRDRARTDDRLDTPGRRGSSVVGRLKFSNDTFGEFAEAFARFMGTPAFLIGMTVVIIIWVSWNAFGPGQFRFDSYPFIFLTLMLSLQASYAAPLILLAQNRQEARDRVSVERDREQAAQSRAEMDFLAREIASLRMSVGELATRDYVRGELRNELRDVLSELDQRVRPADDRES